MCQKCCKLLCIYFIDLGLGFLPDALTYFLTSWWALMMNQTCHELGQEPNFRIAWKSLPEPNTLAYYVTTSSVKNKCFYHCLIKCFHSMVCQHCHFFLGIVISVCANICKNKKRLISRINPSWLLKIILYKTRTWQQIKV